LLVGVTVSELANTPSSDWLATWLGHNWSTCPWRILLLAAPIFIGLIWAFRVHGADAPAQRRHRSASSKEDCDVRYEEPT
jgi:hypothetical protein